MYTSTLLTPLLLLLTTPLISAAPPTAVTKQPFTTLAAPPISTSISTDKKTITFVEGTNENPPDTRFKFPTVPVNGYANLVLRSDGTYDNHGLLRNDGPGGVSYNVAYWWKIVDAAGRKYYFGSDPACGPTKKLKDRGDVCDWSQDNVKMDKISKNWSDLTKSAKATGFPVVFAN